MEFPAGISYFVLSRETLRSISGIGPKPPSCTFMNRIGKLLDIRVGPSIR